MVSLKNPLRTWYPPKKHTHFNANAGAHASETNGSFPKRLFVKGGKRLPDQLPGERKHPLQLRQGRALKLRIVWMGLKRLQKDTGAHFWGTQITPPSFGSTIPQRGGLATRDLSRDAPTGSGFFNRSLLSSPESSVGTQGPFRLHFGFSKFSFVFHLISDTVDGRNLA